MDTQKNGCWNFEGTGSGLLEIDVTLGRKSLVFCSIPPSSFSRSGVWEKTMSEKADTVAADRGQRRLIISPLFIYVAYLTQDTVQYAVPSSARPHLLGAKGRTLIAIQTKTGVQITVPPRTKEQQEASFEPADANDDDLDAEEEMVDVAIEGDVESIEAAKEEIDQIVSKVRKAPTMTEGST